MTRKAYEDLAVRVPPWVVDLESFRRWTDDDDFPEEGRFAFLNGEVWFDTTKEQVFWHNQMKNELSFVLNLVIRERDLGLFFPDGIFLSHVEAAVSNQPDGMFASHAAFEEGRIAFVEGRIDGHVEVEGTPDMVLEIVSRSSVEKDTEVLRQAYAAAGICEYWLVDARADTLEFDILRLDRGAYRATRKRNGWLRSEVFERSFRLGEKRTDKGHPKYILEVRGGEA